MDDERQASRVFGPHWAPFQEKAPVGPDGTYRMENEQFNRATSRILYRASNVTAAINMIARRFDCSLLLNDRVSPFSRYYDFT